MGRDTVRVPLFRVYIAAEFSRPRRLRFSEGGRAMDNPLTPRNLDALASLAWAWSLDFVPRIVSAAIVLCFGMVVAQWASRSIARLLVGAPHVDPTIRPILASTV